MGLDSVELILEVEDCFKIRISDSSCEKVTTVADLVAVVINHLPRYSSPCPTAQHFRTLRSQLSKTSEIPTRSFRPKTPLADVFPRPHRRRLWSKFAEGSQFVPPLVAPRAIDRGFLVTFWVCAFLWVVMMGIVFFALGGLAASGVGLGTLGIVAVLIVFLYKRCTLCFPQGCLTVADLVRLTMPTPMPSGAGDILAAENVVLQTVRQLTADQLGLSLDRVQPESRFVQDLGMG